MDQNRQNNVLINNYKTGRPTEILMLILGSLDNLIQDAYIIYQKGIYNFEILG